MGESTKAHHQHDSIPSPWSKQDEAPASKNSFSEANGGEVSAIGALAGPAQYSSAPLNPTAAGAAHLLSHWVDDGTPDGIPWDTVNRLNKRDPVAHGEWQGILRDHKVQGDPAHSDYHDTAANTQDKGYGKVDKKPLAPQWLVHYKGTCIGKVEQQTYEVFDEPDTAGLTIGLQFKHNPTANKVLGDFTQIRWLQVINTNDSSLNGTSERYVDPQEPDESIKDPIKPFYYTDEEEQQQEAKSKDGLDTFFSDQPKRPKSDATPKRPKVEWAAELALTGVTKSGKLVTLKTLHYGFNVTYDKGTGMGKEANLENLWGGKGPTKEFTATVAAFIQKHTGTMGTKP